MRKNRTKRGVSPRYRGEVCELSGKKAASRNVQYFFTIASFHPVLYFLLSY